MDILAAVILSFSLLILSIYRNIFIAYPLLLSLIIFMLTAHRRGYKFRELLCMAYKGGKKSFVVLKIFILIGAITSIWMASGTVPAIVYYGIKFLNPRYFILFAFLVSCIVSFLIGTSFGTVSTVGIALMVMSKGGGMNINIVAGAIIAGAYFGDRCSPMSSSAVLVAHLTDTDLYRNIKNMLKTALIPFMLSVIFYIVISLKGPIAVSNSSMGDEIARLFNINIIVLIPAFIILLLSAFKVDVRISMVISIIAASIISILLQNRSFIDVLRYILMGYEMNYDSPLKAIIKGGGLVSMLKVAIVVFISSAFSGIFEGINILAFMEKIFQKAKKRHQLLFLTTLVSIAAAGFGCSQAIAVILTHQLVKKVYDESHREKYETAIDIENTAVVISPLIPWNIAGLVPATTLMVGHEFIPYAFYLYIIPVVNILYLKLMEMRIK